MDPKTLIEAVRHFADEQTCFEYLVAMKWPDGKITCPKCECDRIGKITSRRMLPLATIHAKIKVRCPEIQIAIGTRPVNAI